MEIKLYITPTCPWSKKLATWLRRRRIPFEECDVVESQNKKYRDELIEKSSQLSVPMIDIDGEIIVGFDPDKIEAAIKTAKEKKVEISGEEE